MIEQLTPEQEKLVEKWRDDGLRRGLNPPPVDPAEAKVIVSRFCRIIMGWQNDPAKVFVEPSPPAAWRRVNAIVAPDRKLAFQSPYLDGHYSSFYFAWVRCWRELGITGIPEAFDVYAETEKLGPVYPLPDFNTVVVSDTTREIHVVNGRLHNERGPAVLYADGFCVCSLHGVRVPKTVVETKPEDMDREWLTKNFIGQQNVEIRKEVLLKAGPDRLMGIFGGKCIDRSGDYELLTLDLGGGVTHPFLKMRNPSTDSLHIESVSRECRTVQEALLFRNNLRPEQIDDERGAKWFQQGDVLLFPRGATKFRSKPEILH